MYYKNYVYHNSEYNQLKCIISDVDGNKYCVRERAKLAEAADRLASTRNTGHLGFGFGKKRGLRKQGIDKKKTTCMLYLQADHLFYEQMGYSEEACIEVMTRHVQRVNSIYRPIGKSYLLFILLKPNFHVNEVFYTQR